MRWEGCWSGMGQVQVVMRYPAQCVHDTHTRAPHRRAMHAAVQASAALLPCIPAIAVS